MARSMRLLVILAIASVYSFAEGGSNEYNIKAMFILNFMKYVEWPAETYNNEFTIGVVGESEIFDALVKMAGNRKESKKINVEKVNADSLGNYQIVIIPKSENKKLEEWVRKFQYKGVLIISDECKNAGAAINLLNINNKIRFEINNTQARLGGIKISSRLAELAVKVHP